MDGAAVKELADRFSYPRQVGEFITAPTTWNVFDPAALVKPGPTADALKVYSLQALCDYATHNRDALAIESLVVHVVSPQIVRLVGPLQTRARNRDVYVEATALNLTDGFLGKFMPTDEFIIGLQTRFGPGDDRDKVLRLFSNISHEAVRTSQDDGISQSVTAKTGIALKGDALVPNPVALVPFRTFREVEQPSSLFALRVNQAMQVGIFEADGGAWRLTSVERISLWLSGHLREGVAVLA